MAGKQRYVKRKRFYKKKDTNRSKDKTLGTANTSKSIVSIMAFNKSPLWKTRRMCLKYSSYYTGTTIANQSNVSDYISISSIFDPNYALTNTAFSNTSYHGYAEFFGTGAGQYRQFRVDYVDVKVKVRNLTANSIVLFVLSASALSPTSDYPTNAFIQNIGNRHGAIARRLDAFGTSNENTITCRVYPWEVLGVSKKTYYSDSDYIRAYDTTTTVGPWLVFSIGDGAAADSSGGSQIVRGQVWIESHITALNPNELMVD